MSPFGLLQEQLNQDPWKIFVCCIFCNLTKRVQAEPFFWEVLKRWPNPVQLAKANPVELQQLIQPLGLAERRSKALIRMSYDYCNKDWREHPTALYGIGKYGSDAYKIFCTPDWRLVEPKDGALINYLSWARENL